MSCFNGRIIDSITELYDVLVGSGIRLTVYCGACQKSLHLKVLMVEKHESYVCKS